MAILFRAEGFSFYPEFVQCRQLGEVGPVCRARQSEPSFALPYSAQAIRISMTEDIALNLIKKLYMVAVELESREFRWMKMANHVIFYIQPLWT